MMSVHVYEAETDAQLVDLLACRAYHRRRSFFPDPSFEVNALVAFWIFVK